MALFLLLAPPIAATDDAPLPERGNYGATTVALLYHQKDVCDAIAGQVIGYFLALEERNPDQSNEERETLARDFVLENQLSDLAASRSIADLIERFLPRAEQEHNSEAGSSLRRLFGLEKELCDAVALPKAPRERFEGRIHDLLDRIEVEQAELGRLLVVPDDAEQAAALEPYLVYIQRAGIEAEGEYLAYLESIRPKPKEPTIVDYMQAWHRQSYLPAVAPTKKALGIYLNARQGKNPRTVGQACRNLSNAVTQLLRDPGRPLVAPDKRLEPILRQAYIDMRTLANACNSGQTREMDKAYRDLQTHLSDAARLMHRYQLRP